MSLFHNTALKQLDKDVRRDFDQAFEVAPELVLKESRFIDFLRIDEFDTHKAAVRLAMYWKNRKILFAERWVSLYQLARRTKQQQ